MKSFLLILLVFVAATVAAQKTKEESATEKFVLKLHETKFRWMVEVKLDSLNRILDERLQYIHSNGWIETKQDVIEDLKSGKLKMIRVKVNEASARVYKGFVVVIGRGDFTVVVDGKPVEIKLLYTELYAKRQSGWMLVSRHANKLTVP